MFPSSRIPADYLLPPAITILAFIALSPEVSRGQEKVSSIETAVEADLEPVNGSVRLNEGSSVSGDIDTVNGKIHVDGVHGRIDLETTNGGVKAAEAGARPARAGGAVHNTARSTRQTAARPCNR